MAAQKTSQLVVELNRPCGVRWPGGHRAANGELAAALSATTGRKIDRQYVWRIRKGHVDKVDANVRDGLCEFFGVPQDYFSRSHSDELSVLIVRDVVGRLGRDTTSLTDAEFAALHHLACDMAAVLTE